MTDEYPNNFIKNWCGLYHNQLWARYHTGFFFNKNATLNFFSNNLVLQHSQFGVRQMILGGTWRNKGNGGKRSGYLIFLKIFCIMHLCNNNMYYNICFFFCLRIKSLINMILQLKAKKKSIKCMWRGNGEDQVHLLLLFHCVRSSVGVTKVHKKYVVTIHYSAIAK